MDEVNEASGTLPAGFEFGAYVIQGCIGQGGMARVYRAQHRALRKPVALKIMEGPLLQRPEWRQRFVREGQAAAAVKHPNVVDITDVGVWQGRPYLVMELLEGEDLEHRLSRGDSLSEAETARLLIPVIAGLALAHACGVVHRDLKPSNVFLARGPEGEIVPKLLDFGISKWAGGGDIDPTSTPHGELMGSPMYMSPEAVRGARDLTPQSDQYSLGVVLYECVTGRAPFEAGSLLAVLDAVARGEVEPPRRYRPDLSQIMEDAILRAMNPEPRLRFPTVRELGRVLCQCADHRTRLLWMPSFGFTEALEGRTTAVLGSTPLRTAAPLNLPAPAASKGSSRRSWLALAGLALAGLTYWGWGRLTVASLSVPERAAAVGALQPGELPLHRAEEASGGAALPQAPGSPQPEPAGAGGALTSATESALFAARPPARAAAGAGGGSPEIAVVPPPRSTAAPARAVPSRAVPARAAPRTVPSRGVPARAAPRTVPSRGGRPAAPPAVAPAPAGVAAPGTGAPPAGAVPAPAGAPGAEPAAPSAPAPSVPPPSVPAPSVPAPGAPAHGPNRAPILD